MPVSDVGATPNKPQKRLASLKPTLLFWLFFFILNFLLFLPLYLLNYQDATFLPRIDSLQELLFSRPNPDIFRLNLEISLLILAFPLLKWLWTPAARKWYARIFFLLYLLALLYAIYEAVTLSLYHTTPVIFNDYRFFISGIGFLVDGLRLSSWQLILMAALILTLIVLFYKLVLRWFTRLPVEKLGRASRLAAGMFMALLAGVILFRGSALARPESVVSSLGMKLAANARASIAAREEIGAYNRIRPEKTYNYAETTRLLRRPNVYLIFVESYGSVLYKRPHFVDDYQELMQETEARLQNAGWTLSTGLSTSPTWGGGSWMAYTSAEFGLHIGSQPQFLAIEDRFSQQPYPSLGRYLQSQGYRHVRLAPIQRKLTAHEYAANDAFYGPDRWITFDDLNYQGPLYGWGPAPPDQFSLNQASQILTEEGDQPLFFFYLTQGSHYPWAPLPPFVNDWRTLNDPHWPAPPPIGEPIPHRDNIEHYREAIRYQWETLSDFILSTSSDEDAIFILIGDHQPPRVSRREDGYETPIHIIARDADFVHRFDRYGFEPGLVVSHLEPDMKHEALYSMLVRALVDAYGVSAEPVPVLPDGIHLDIPTPTPAP